jgi:hypothetical protein
MKQMPWLVALSVPFLVALAHPLIEGLKRRDARTALGADADLYSKLPDSELKAQLGESVERRLKQYVVKLTPDPTVPAALTRRQKVKISWAFVLAALFLISTFWYLWTIFHPSTYGPPSVSVTPFCYAVLAIGYLWLGIRLAKRQGIRNASAAKESALKARLDENLAKEDARRTEATGT